MLDVLIAGAGPAGTTAALVLARAGARVLVVDRETFPRDKFCGDTVNPGVLALVDELHLDGGPLGGARPLAGMRLTGPGRSVRAIYGGDRTGRAITRRVFDAWLLEQAIAAGAKFEAPVIVRGPLVDPNGKVPRIRGVRATVPDRGDAEVRLPALVTIAADGRRSALARALGLSHIPRRPRRWAFGAYATDVAGMADVGEMHVRQNHYVGLAPIGNGLTNICLVTADRAMMGPPLAAIRRAVARDAELADRIRGAILQPQGRVLGPLAVDASPCGADGLLLAGDAAGFVDPITGDGIHLAMRGGMLAAAEALQVLQDGRFLDSPWRLADARARAIGPKLRFNRVVRRLVGSAAAVNAASGLAAVWPSLIRHAVGYAGDLR